MKEVFTHIDSVRVGFCKSILEQAGIPCFVRNEHTNLAFTAIPVPIFYPALCVRDNDDYDEAMELIKKHIHADEPDQAGWMCPSCNQLVPGGFEVCWNCQAEKPGMGAPAGEGKG